MNTQKCRVCNQTKPITDFYKNSNYKSGYLNKCKDCIKEYDKQRIINHKGPRTTGTKKCSFCGKIKSVSEFSKRLRAADGLRNRCKICDRAEEKKYRERNPKQQKARKLKANYGLSIQQYNKMLKAQNNKCAICGNKTTLEIDHCHRTGKVRGLLCHLCNIGLGSFTDNINKLQNAIQYLKDNNE